MPPGNASVVAAAAAAAAAAEAAEALAPPPLNIWNESGIHEGNENDLRFSRGARLVSLALVWLATALEAAAMDQLRLRKWSTAVSVLTVSGLCMLIALKHAPAHEASAIAGIGVGLLCWFEGLPFHRRRTTGALIAAVGIAIGFALEPPPHPARGTNAQPNPGPTAAFWTALLFGIAIGVANGIHIIWTAAEPPAQRPTARLKLKLKLIEAPPPARATAILASIATSTAVTAAGLSAARHLTVYSSAATLVFVILDIALAAISLRVNPAQIHAPCVYVGWELGTVAADAVVLNAPLNTVAIMVQLVGTVVGVALMFTGPHPAGNRRRRTHFTTNQSRGLLSEFELD